MPCSVFNLHLTLYVQNFILNKMESIKYNVEKADDDIIVTSVSDNRKHAVDNSFSNCSCSVWENYGLSCTHIFVCRKNESKVSKGTKIRNRYNQVPHPTQGTNGKVTNSQLDTINGSQEVSPFPAVDHKAHINRRAQRHSRHKTEQKHKRSTKEVPPWNGQ